uniref:Uncharacterized protein n=1 Tax=Lepeophtheirus salmonis TaxID=72036 RepID=A0A0K2UJG4_LEPSM
MSVHTYHKHIVLQNIEILFLKKKIWTQVNLIREMKRKLKVYKKNFRSKNPGDSILNFHTIKAKINNHSNGSYCPNNCYLALRSSNNLSIFPHNLDKDGLNNLNITGVFFYSIAKPPLSQTESIDQIILPLLHIQMGIVQKLFSLLCEKI